MINLDILILHNTFLPDYTGSSIRLYNLVSRIPYNISVVTPEKMVNGEYFRLKSEKINNIQIKRVKSLSPPSIWKMPVFRYFYHEKKIFNHCKNEKFDIIQARSLPPYIVTAYKLHKKFKTPLLLELHPNEKDVNQFYMFYVMNILKIAKKASHTITLTNSLKNWVQKEYSLDSEKITVIPNGVDCEKFKPGNKSNTGESLRNKIGNPEKIVLYAGYLDQVNGMDMLIKIIPTIVRENPEISFVFMGNGPYYNTINELSKKIPQVNLLKTVNHELMPDYYLDSDIFIIPRPSTISSELVTPLKLLEAMSMESIVLGSNVGGISEVITNEKNGYLYEKDDPKSFIDLLVTSLEHDNSRIARNARKTIINEYSWEKSAAKLKNIYDFLNPIN
ncbi:MAG: Membrane-anchored group 1 glycosyltransferase protein [Methanobacterium sp. 42_16]|nr:MAG: Membrane-anchored group 1 glycosyltransferase protein [Methanobacterium sp. 42_16]